MQKTNKLQRTISIHNLDCLVFEKRQRKQATQFTLNSIKQKPQKTKQISKTTTKQQKISKKNNNLSGQNLHKPKVKKAQKQDKKIQEPKKKLGRPRKILQNKPVSTQSKLKDNQQSEKIKKRQSNQEGSKKQDQINKERPQSAKNTLIDKQKLQEMGQKILQKTVNHQNVVIMQQQVSQSSLSEQQIDIEQKKQFQDKDGLKNQEIDYIEEENNTPKQKQQSDQINQQIQEQLSNNDKQSQKLEKKLIPAPLRKILTQELKQNKQEQNPSNQKSKQSSQGISLIRRSARNATKKVQGRAPQYQDFNQYSDWSIVQPQKRKYKTKEQQCYNLNRIFRKTNKVEQPSFTIQLDLNQVSISSVISSMPKFQIVHCSLPLSMLIQLPQLSFILHKGFIFIWVQKGEIQMGYHLLNRWGFDVIDQIMWIKSNQTQYTLIYDQVENDTSNGYKQANSLFLNCRSTCLVGYKCPANQKVDYCTKISNNVIFAEDSSYKPEQIYEIAELMMPGSRRLQIGKQVQGDRGWFALKHIETSFTRCKLCFKNPQNMNLVKKSSKQKQVQCTKCYHKIVKLQNEENGPTTQNICAWNLKLIVNKKCPQYLKCNKCSQQMLSRSLIKVQEKLYCSKCFPNTLPSSTNLIVQFPPKFIYELKPISCSDCSKKILNLAYFECGNCKCHNLCQQCFWKQQQDLSHDWKLRPIITGPQMKILCFNCQSQCLLPYWGCETCIDWFWCGSCEMVKQCQSYAHYGANHNLALIV